MSVTYNLSIVQNPSFNTVNSLTNLVFDRNNVRSGRMATEDQIQQLWQDIIRLEERIDYCCREIVYWDFRIKINDRYGFTRSDYLENRTTGIMRRGKNFTMKLPIKAVPKYETETASTSTTSKACVNDSQGNTYVNGLCSLLYRGDSGEYYEMSDRKNTPGLGFFVSNQNRSGLAAYHINNAGVQSTVNYITTNNPRFPVNTHFARVDENNDIYIDVYAPVDEDVQFSSSSDLQRPYGRIYLLELRDVTLG